MDGVMPLLDGPKLILTADIVTQLLSDPSFYDTVDAFLFLKEQGLSAWQASQDQMAGRAGCRTCRQANHMQTPIVAFCRMVGAMHAIDPVKLEPLAAYISARRGYRPRPIVVFWKEGPGQPIHSVAF